MPPRKWDLRIRDILASIERIKEYTRNLDFEQFSSDTKTPTFGFEFKSFSLELLSLSSH